MKLITRQQQAKDCANRWYRAYIDSAYWNDDKKNIYKKLLALGENPKPDDVDSIIGNKSWTRLTCDECDASCESIVELGKEPDYESATAWICPDCLRRACSMVKILPKENKND